MNLTTKRICENAIVAGIYVVLTAISMPLSFQLLQFRLAEILMLLCFFRKDFVIGVTIGCLIANVSGSLAGLTGWIDVAIGTSATLISGLIMPYCKRLFISSLVPVVLNGLIVGAELSYILELGNFGVCFGFVALGEVVCVSIVGYCFFLLLRKRYNFDHIISANINLDSRW